MAHFWTRFSTCLQSKQNDNIVSRSNEQTARFLHLADGTVRALFKMDDSGYVGNKGLVKSKIDSAKKLPLLVIEPGTLGLHLWHILCYKFMPFSLS